jgi:hypothetical protein
MSTTTVPMLFACPCGGALETAAAVAHGVCDRCRVDAHKRVKREPDFTDVPLPGLENWGLT